MLRVALFVGAVHEGFCRNIAAMIRWVLGSGTCGDFLRIRAAGISNPMCNRQAIQKTGRPNPGLGMFDGSTTPVLVLGGS